MASVAPVQPCRPGTTTQSLLARRAARLSPPSLRLSDEAFHVPHAATPARSRTSLHLVPGSALDRPAENTVEISTTSLLSPRPHGSPQASALPRFLTPC